MAHTIRCERITQLISQKNSGKVQGWQHQKLIPQFFLGGGKGILDPKDPPDKRLCGSLFCILSQEMRHINLCGSLFCILPQEMRHIYFFLGAKMRVLGGGIGHKNITVPDPLTDGEIPEKRTSAMSW